MHPTLRSGQIVLVNRLAYLFRSPTPGELVVMAHPRHHDRRLVKRIDRATGEGWFVRGDNPGGSVDSRHFGSVPSRLIRGRVVFVGG